MLVTSPHRRQYFEVSFRSLQGVVACRVCSDTPLKRGWLFCLKIWEATGKRQLYSMYSILFTALREVIEPLLEVCIYIVCVVYCKYMHMLADEIESSEHTEQVQLVSL